MKIALIALIAVAALAQDKITVTPGAPTVSGPITENVDNAGKSTPVIPADHLEAFERARVNEMETKAAHEADVAKVKAAYDVLVADCKGEIPVQPDRDKPATCPSPKPAEAKK